MSYIEIVPASGRVVVRWKGHTVVDTTRALELREGSYPPVLYTPREDADMSLLAPSPRHTTCPHKGEASYFNLHAEGATSPRVLAIGDLLDLRSPDARPVSAPLNHAPCRQCETCACSAC